MSSAGAGASLRGLRRVRGRDPDGGGRAGLRRLCGADGKAGGQLYFAGTGGGLWTCDGTAAGTSEVSTLQVTPASLTAANGELYFVATDAGHGAEVWAYDPSAKTTTLVVDAVPGATGSQPGFLTAGSGGLYFVANDAGSANELWFVNGAHAVSELTNPSLGRQHEGSVEAGDARDRLGPVLHRIERRGRGGVVRHRRLADALSPPLTTDGPCCRSATSAACSISGRGSPRGHPALGFQLATPQGTCRDHLGRGAQQHRRLRLHRRRRPGVFQRDGPASRWPGAVGLWRPVGRGPYGGRPQPRRRRLQPLGPDAVRRRALLRRVRWRLQRAVAQQRNGRQPPRPSPPSPTKPIPSA